MPDAYIGTYKLHLCMYIRCISVQSCYFNYSDPPLPCIVLSTELSDSENFVFRLPA